MYHYIDDKEFLHEIRALSGEIMQDLCHTLKEDHQIGANFYLVGSGARNLITQNASNPVDLDYNLEIVKCEDFHDCRHLKECVTEAFNKSLCAHDLSACEDSKSALTTKQIFIRNGNRTGFSIDVCITFRDETDNYYRLIHEKTGFVYFDRYYWNEAPHSAKLKRKADVIKKAGKWELVRQQYLNLKNQYLSWNASDHPSFVCYIEAVNNVYNSIKHWG